MRKDERGYIVIETLGSFILFTLLVVSILSMINITTVQMRVHYALTQTATELSMYSYIIHAIGLSDAAKQLNVDGAEGKELIDSILNDASTISSGITATDFHKNLDVVIDAIGSLTGTLSDVAQNPKETFNAILLYGLSELKDTVMQELIIRSMISKYLSNGTMDAATYLKSYNVVERSGRLLDISDSVYIDSVGDIIIVASYEIDYVFGALPLPFTTIKVRQTAKTKAWLGGDEWSGAILW